MGVAQHLNRRGKPQVLATMFPLTDRATRFGIPLFEPQPNGIRNHPQYTSDGASVSSLAGSTEGRGLGGSLLTDFLRRVPHLDVTFGGFPMGFLWSSTAKAYSQQLTPIL